MTLPQDESNLRAKQAGNFTADGREEAIRSNALYERQAEAATRIRRSYAAQISAASWPRRLRIKLRMLREIRREKRRIEQEIAPREGLYLRCGTVAKAVGRQTKYERLDRAT